MENSLKLIEALGGATKLAAQLQIPVGTVQSWKVRGIPLKWWIEKRALWRKAKRICSVESEQD
jgi:hypothetical protein